MFMRLKKNGTEAAENTTGPAGTELRSLLATAEQSLKAAEASMDASRIKASSEFGRTVGLSVDMSELLCLTAWSNGNVRKLSGETVAISGAVEEMARTIQNIAELSGAAQIRSGEAASLVATGAGRARTAGRAMDEISAAFAGLDDRMKLLGTAIEQIGGFAKQIEGISSQTKLLALNATIEAARAGEAGRGFAVVAAEVKALSEETSKTTDLIRGQLTQLGEVMSAMFEAMQAGGAKVRDGQGLFTEVVTDMEGISDRVGEVNVSIGSIAGMLGDQQIASESIAKSLSEIARLAAQNETDSRTAADLIHKSDGGVRELLDSAEIGVTQGTVRRLRSRHMEWKRGLAECLVGLAKADPAEFSRRNKPFGANFEDIRDEAVTGQQAFRGIRTLSEKLAAEAASMIGAVARGDIGKGIEHYMSMDGFSSDAMTKLTDLNRTLGFHQG